MILWGIEQTQSTPQQELPGQELWCAWRRAGAFGSTQLPSTDFVRRMIRSVVGALLCKTLREQLRPFATHRTLNCSTVAENTCSFHPFARTKMIPARRLLVSRSFPRALSTSVHCSRPKPPSGKGLSCFGIAAAVATAAATSFGGTAMEPEPFSASKDTYRGRIISTEDIAACSNGDNFVDRLKVQQWRNGENYVRTC